MTERTECHAKPHRRARNHSHTYTTVRIRTYSRGNTKTYRVHSQHCAPKMIHTYTRMRARVQLHNLHSIESVSAMPHTQTSSNTPGRVQWHSQYPHKSAHTITQTHLVKLESHTHTPSHMRAHVKSHKLHPHTRRIPVHSHTLILTCKRMSDHTA
jgi:hypothetical protein